MTESFHLRGDVLAHKTSVAPPLCIEVPLPSHESEQSCICVLEIYILPVYMIFCLDFGIMFGPVPLVVNTSRSFPQS